MGMGMLQAFSASTMYREKEETLSAMMAEMNGATPALMKLVWAAEL